MDTDASQVTVPKAAGPAKKVLPVIKAWVEESRTAIERRREWVDHRGLWSDGLRLF